MTLADSNVLINAFRADASDHKRCRRWLGDTIHGDARFGISPQVLSSVIRITTNKKIFVRPSPLEETMEFSEVLLEQPHSEVIQPGDRHWAIFTRLCRGAAVTGKLVPNAWFAALAIESGCEWITLDRDYARFPGLKWRSPE